MAKKKHISPRKDPVQRRSIELRDSILEAATYILKKEGPKGFTTNKVAEKAGVNIASLYQYYPNKESLLFHLVEIEWNSTLSTVFPILQDETKSHTERLKLFILKFYETEFAEGDLKRATTSAGLSIESTEEYKSLTEKAETLFKNFLSTAIKTKSKSDLDQKSDFIHHTISSFSECMPTEEWNDLKSDAIQMAEMISKTFKFID